MNHDILRLDFLGEKSKGGEAPGRRPFLPSVSLKAKSLRIQERIVHLMKGAMSLTAIAGFNVEKILR